MCETNPPRPALRAREAVGSMTKARDGLGKHVKIGLPRPWSWNSSFVHFENFKSPRKMMEGIDPLTVAWDGVRPVG